MPRYLSLAALIVMLIGIAEGLHSFAPVYAPPFANLSAAAAATPIDSAKIFPTKQSLLPTGTTYTDTIPDTLDLADRAKWFIRGAIQTQATSLYSSPAGMILHPDVNLYACPPGASRPCFFYNPQNWGKVMLALTYARTMTPYDRSDVDHTLETQYRMMTQMLSPSVSEDLIARGLGSQVIPTHCDQGCMTPVTVAMQAILAQWEQAPNQNLKEAVDSFVRMHLTQRKSFTDSSGRTFTILDWQFNPNKETALGYMGDYLGPFIQGKALRVMSEIYLFTGDPSALALANELSEFIRNYESNLFWKNPDPVRFPHVKGQFVGHIHAYLQAAIGLVDHAAALRKTDPQSSLAAAEVNLANDVYNFVKSRTRAGKIGNFGESGSTGDMAILAIKLTDQGVAYYYEDAESWTRNALAEMQIDSRAGQYQPNYARTFYEDSHTGSKSEGMFFSDGTHIFSIPFKNDAGTSDYSANSFAGMHEVWKKTVEYKNNFAQINFLLNRASTYIDIKSDLPYRGQIEVKTKQNLGPITSFGIRIPSWADRSKVSIVLRESNGAERTLASNEWFWIPGTPYVQVDNLKPIASYFVKFPIKVYTQPVYEMRSADAIWYEGSYASPSVPESVVTYTGTFRGDTLVSVTPAPADGGIPRYERSALASLPATNVAPPTKTVERFVATGE